MTCARCKREINPEQAVWSVYRRTHYCGPHEWAECDRRWFAELAAAQAEKENAA